MFIRKTKLKLIVFQELFLRKNYRTITDFSKNYTAITI